MLRKIYKTCLLCVTVISFNIVARTIVPSHEPSVPPPAITTNQLSDSEIQQKYIASLSKVQEGKITLRDITGALVSVVNELLNGTTDDFMRKQLSIKNLIKSIGYFVNNEDSLSNPSDDARAMRTALFFKIQKALEIKDDLIATKNLTWKALSE